MIIKFKLYSKLPGHGAYHSVFTIFDTFGRTLEIRY